MERTVVCDLRLLEQIRLRRRIERVTSYFGAQCIEPQREPTAFEAGMPGNEDTAALPERTIQHDWSRAEFQPETDREMIAEVRTRHMSSGLP